MLPNFIHTIVMEACGGHANVCSGYAKLKSRRLREQHLYISIISVLDLLTTNSVFSLASGCVKSVSMQKDVKLISAFDSSSLRDLLGSSSTAPHNHWVTSSAQVKP